MKNKRSINSAYTELAILLILIVAAGFLLNRGDPFWTKFSPSPYWLPVLLIPLRYGNPSGIVSGITCAVIYYLARFALTEHTFFESIFLTPQTLLLPAVFIALSHYIGENTHTLQMRTEFFRTELQEAKKSIDQLESEKTHLEQSYRELEGQIAGESSSLYRLLSSLHVFSKCDYQDIAPTACALAHRFVAGQSCSYWRYSNNSWQKIYPGTGGEPPELLNISMKENRSVSVRDFPSSTFSEEADLVVSMPSNGKGEVDAMCLSGIQFSQWHPRLSDKLQTILWLAITAYKRCQLQQTITDTLPYERQLSLSGEAFLRVHVQKALLAQERAGGISSMFFLRAKGENKRDLRVLAIIASALRCLLRDSDAKAYLRKSGYFAIFMPGTPKEGGKIACEKITASLNELQVFPHGQEVNFETQFHELTDRNDIDRILASINQEQSA